MPRIICEMPGCDNDASHTLVNHIDDHRRVDHGEEYFADVCPRHITAFQLGGFVIVCEAGELTEEYDDA